ncbi:ATP-binding protein [bacterium]|nr:ATP-binding protein [bacterium]
MTDSKDGLAGKVFRTVGKILTTAGHTAGTTGQRAALTFASAAKGKVVPLLTPKELAGRMANDLASPLEIHGDAYHVIWTEPGLLANRFAFVFAPTLQAVSGNVAYILSSWPPDRFEVDPSLSIFVWDRGLRLGPRSAAADYVSMWLKSWLGFVFDGRELVAKPPAVGPRGLFVGRQAELEKLGRLLDDHSPERKWIVSLTAHGGTGKSYFLERFERRYQARMLFAHIDHQNVEAAGGTLTTLTSLISALATKFAAGGCVTPRFDKAYGRFVRTLKPETQTQESGLVGLMRKAVRSGSGVLPAFGAAEASLKFYDSLSEDARKEAEALANNSWIQKLTGALVDDLKPFVEKQRSDYLLWRRPVLVFDTYELLAVIADTWLRICLLKNPAFQALAPVVVTAGRHSLLRIDTRWSEHQEAILQLPLRPFEEAQTREYFEALGATPEQIENYLPLTGGLPLFVSLVANCNSTDSAVRLLTGRVLEEIEPEWRPHFFSAAVADGFNRDILGRLLDGNLPQAYERLTRCTFVESHQGLWHFAPLVRTLLVRSLELESPDRLREIRSRLA